jgi:CheY-like chemotaxis protein
MRRKIKVLAVDDNPVNLSILEEILGTEYRVEFAQSGEQAIRIASKSKPAFVLLDVMMPGMDGLETCRRLRMIGDLRDTTIVMVSAKAMPSEQAAGMKAGADDYLTKPFDEVELLETLRSHLKPRPGDAGCLAPAELDDHVRMVF